MYFDQSVRGLTPGAPVEFRGLPIGEVVDIKLTYDIDTQEVRIPVLVMIEPERLELTFKGEKVDVSPEMLTEDSEQEDDLMFNDGLRAQLATGNLLTGQLYIDLDIRSEAEPYIRQVENGYTVFPTVPSPLGEVAKDIDSILKKSTISPSISLATTLTAQ